MKNYIYVISIIVLFVFSCKRNSSNGFKNITNIVEDISYVKGYPKTYTLRNGIKPKIDFLGMKNLKVYDSLLIISKLGTEKFWSLYSLPNYRKLGNFINKGRGPFEFLFLTHFGNSTTFSTEQGVHYSYILENPGSNLLKFNIDESICTNQTKMSVFKDSLLGDILVCFPIDRTNIFISELKNNDTRINRYVIENGLKRTTPLLDKLNRISIQKGTDVNALTAMIIYNVKKKHFVEIAPRLNYLIIYKLYGSFPRAVCLENKLLTVDKLCKTPRDEWLSQFTDLRGFDDFFSVLYTKGSKYMVENSEQLRSSILIFDWEGNPLAKLVLLDEIHSFDIDIKNGMLYTFNMYKEGAFYKYDIKHVLKDLKPSKN